MRARFRSRFVFVLLSKFDLAKSLEWHYNKIHHGKEPMDGAGGTVKNLLFRAVKPEEISVKTPEELVNAANLLRPLIPSIYLPVSEMLVKSPNVANTPPVSEIFAVQNKCHDKAV